MSDAYSRAARQQEYAGGLTAIALWGTFVLVILLVFAWRLTMHRATYVVRGADTSSERPVSWWW